MGGQGGPREIDKRSMSPHNFSGLRGRLTLQDGRWIVVCGVCATQGDVGRIDPKVYKVGSIPRLRQLARKILRDEIGGWSYVRSVGHICPHCTDDVESGELDLVQYKKDGSPLLSHGATEGEIDAEP